MNPTLPCVVVGASGAIGRFLLPRLRAAGHEVIALSRSVRTSGDPGLRWLVADLHTHMPTLPPCAAIFSVGPLDAFSRWFAQTSDVTAPRVIAIGSMSIETKADSGDSGERAVVQRLRQAELDLATATRARGGALTVLRPTLIYGAGVDRSLTPIVQFAQRWRMFPRVIGARGLRQPVHADDLAAACLAVLAHACTEGRTYALGGGERLAFETMLQRVRASLPLRTLMVPVPLGAARYLIGVAQAVGWPAVHAAAIERLGRDLIADHSMATADFGWAPRAFQPQAVDWTAA